VNFHTIPNARTRYLRRRPVALAIMGVQEALKMLRGLAVPLPAAPKPGETETGMLIRFFALAAFVGFALGA
jgi:hypothetical protein